MIFILESTVVYVLTFYVVVYMVFIFMRVYLSIYMCVAFRKDSDKLHSCRKDLQVNYNGIITKKLFRFVWFGSSENISYEYSIC